jgi:hypothetical protein
VPATTCLGRIAILWRGDDAARPSAMAERSRFKAVFAALSDVGVDAQPVVYEDDVVDAVRTRLARVDGVLVWVNPIHEGRNRTELDVLLRELSSRGIWVRAHPDVILKMGTKEVLHRTRAMSWGCDTALFRTVEAMRAELPTRLAAGPRVIKRNRGNGGQGVWKVEMLTSPPKRQVVRVLDATGDTLQELGPAGMAKAFGEIEASAEAPRPDPSLARSVARPRARTKAAHAEHEQAKAELKKLMPKDARQAIGHGLQPKR